MGGYVWLAREARRRERYAEHVDALAVVEAKAAGAGAGAVARCRAQMLTRGWTKRVLIARETEVEWYKLDVAQEAKRVGSQGHKGSRAIKTKLDALDGEQKRLNSLLLPGEPDPHTRMALAGVRARCVHDEERNDARVAGATETRADAQERHVRRRQRRRRRVRLVRAPVPRRFRRRFGHARRRRGRRGRRRSAAASAAARGGVKVEACVRVTHHEKSIS